MSVRSSLTLRSLETSGSLLSTVSLRTRQDLIVVIPLLFYRSLAIQEVLFAFLIHIAFYFAVVADADIARLILVREPRVTMPVFYTFIYTHLVLL